MSRGRQKKSRWIFQAIILVIIIAVFFVGVKSVLAEEVTAGSVVSGTVGAAVATVIGWITSILAAIIGLILTLLIKILVNVAQFNNIINVDAVITGWVIIRDLCNMSFILILLVIAFATILRQENYSAKKLLPKLLIMAVLINFSKTIFGLLIDFSQVIMLTFVNGFSTYGPGNLINLFNIQTYQSINWGIKGEITNFSVAGAFIAGLLAMIITTIVVAVMLAVLVARIVMLWIYTIFSPLVFLGFAFPPLQKYTGKIWEDFTKQVVVGPVLAFFIWLSLTTAQKSASTLGNFGAGTGISGETCAGINAMFCEGRLQTYVITIGLLMGGLMVAQEFGGAAASIAGKGLDWAKKTIAAPLKMAKAGLERVNDKIHKETGLDLNLVRVWQSWNERRKQNAEDRYRSNVQKAGEAMEKGGYLHGIAALTGAGGDAWNQIASFRGLKERFLGAKKGWGRFDVFRYGGGKGRERAIKEGVATDEEAELRHELEYGTLKKDANGKDMAMPGTYQALLAEKGKMLDAREFSEVTAEKAKAEAKLKALGQTKIMRETDIKTLEVSLATNPNDQASKDALAKVQASLQAVNNDIAIQTEIKDRNDQRLKDAGNKSSFYSEISKKNEEIQARKEEVQRKVLEESTRPDGKLYGTMAGMKIGRDSVWTKEERMQNELEIKIADESLKKLKTSLAEVTQRMNDANKGINPFKSDEERASHIEKQIKYQQMIGATESSIKQKQEKKRTKKEVTGTEYQKLTTKMEKKQEEIDELVPIYNVEARKLEEMSISREADKIKNVDDANELVRITRTAIKEKNKGLVKAALRQLTAQYNDNEATEALVGDSSYLGVQNLMRGLAGMKMLDKNGKETDRERPDLNAGFSKQEAFRLGAQIAEMNKRTSHWEATAAYMMDHGSFREANKREHILVASTELGKRGPQANMRDNNRLASGKHIVNEYGVKVWQPVEIGMIMLQSFDNGRMIGRLAENMTESSAKYYAMTVDGIRGIEKLISPNLIDAIKEKAGLSAFQNVQFERIEELLRASRNN